MIPVHSRSEVYHTSSSADSCVQTPVQQTAVPCLSDPAGSQGLPFTEGTCPRRLFCHLTLIIDQLHERKVILSSHVSIILAECRGDMDHTGTVCERYIAVTRYKV